MKPSADRAEAGPAQDCGGAWWCGAVVYQVYPRSFQDSDGDGIGDLAGIEDRLDHVVELGVDALWLSPIYPSPLADFGYDVTDHAAVDPVYGALADFESLAEAARDRGLRLLLDLVPCHTSIQHPWFRAHPERYVWADGRGDDPPNNWRAAFGGPAWTRDADSGRWFLHSFTPQQPDLDWRNPDVPAAMGEVMRFWLDLGVDGFRVDALDRIVKDEDLRDDPPASAPSALPEPEEYAQLEHLYSRNAPDVRDALAALREAAGDALLVGEVYLPAAEAAPYLEYMDAVFAFELFHAPFEPAALRAAIESCAALVRPGGVSGAAWVLSNHDYPRLATRFGPQNVRAAAMLLLTLPGLTFVYQGEEIGMTDGPGPSGPPLDRIGRDVHRHPMQWDGSPLGGFTRGSPWLPVADAPVRNVADQARSADSLLALYRELIRLRRTLGPGLDLVDAPAGVLAYERGDHLVALNTAPTTSEAPAVGAEVVLATSPDAYDGDRLAPHGGVIVVRR